jgi:hypothetical protein
MNLPLDFNIISKKLLCYSHKSYRYPLPGPLTNTKLANLPNLVSTLRVRIEPVHV